MKGKTKYKIDNVPGYYDTYKEALRRLQAIKASQSKSSNAFFVVNDCLLDNYKDACMLNASVKFNEFKNISLDQSEYDSIAECLNINDGESFTDEDLSNIKLDNMFDKIGNLDFVKNEIEKIDIDEAIKLIENKTVSLETFSDETDGSHVHNEINPYGLHRHEFENTLSGSHSHPDGRHYHFAKLYNYDYDGAHTHADNEKGTHKHDVEEDSTNKDISENIDNETISEMDVINVNKNVVSYSDGKYKVILMKHGLAASGHFYPQDLFVTDISAFDGGKNGRLLKMYLNHASKDELSQGVRNVENICGHYENVHLNESGFVSSDFLPAEKTPSGEIAISLLEHNKKIVELSTVLTVGYRMLTNSEKEEINDRRAKYMVVRILNCSSCDLVTRGGAGGEFLNNSDYEFNANGKLIKKDNGGVNFMKLNKKEIIDLINDDYPEVFEDIAHKAAKEAEDKLLGELESRGKKTVLKNKLEEIENEKKKLTDEIENLGKTINEKDNSIQELTKKINKYEKAIVANTLVDKEIPGLNAKPRTYLYKQLTNCKDEAEMGKIIEEFKDVFNETIKKSTVKNNGAVLPDNDGDKDAETLFNMNILGFSEMIGVPINVDEDGNYEEVELED